MNMLFPGALRKLPVHLKDIGLGALMNPNFKPAEPEAAAEDEQIEEAA
jgi:hypothetical protein